MIVPTLNRPEYVLRQARYYAQTGPGVSLYIGDGSSTENSERLRAGLEQLAATLQVHYFHWPEKNDFQTIRDLLVQAGEKYSVYCGDDDLQFGPTLLEAADFLERNPEYSHARGEAFAFMLKGDGAYGEISGTFPYTQLENEKPTAVERLETFFDRYNVTMFSVQATANLRRAFACMDENLIHRTMTEILPCTLTAAAGKGKVLRGRPGFFRQVMEVKYAMAATLDLICSDRWPESARIFLREVSSEVARIDGLSSAEADQVSRRALSRYVGQSLLNQAKQKRAAPPRKDSLASRIAARIKRSLRPASLEEDARVLEIYEFLRTGTFAKAES